MKKNIVFLDSSTFPSNILFPKLSFNHTWKNYKFTKKAAEGKEPYAINNLALMYEEGYSVKKDLNKAFELYLITLDYENAPWYTDSNIGTFFLLGKGNSIEFPAMGKDNINEFS